MVTKKGKKAEKKNQTNNKKKEIQEPAKPKKQESQTKDPKEQLKAPSFVTADDVVPLDPSKAGIGLQKPPPAERKTRGPDKQPRKKRIDAKPDDELEQKQPEVPAIDSAPVEQVPIVDIMAVAKVNTLAFVTTFDVLFCGWCPPRLSAKDKQLLIEVWVPIVHENGDQIPAWVPAALVTLGIMGDRLITKFSD